MKQTVNQRIKIAREALGYDQQEASKLLDMHPSNYSRIENSDRSPYKTTIKRIVSSFGINEHWLLTGNGEMINEDHLHVNDEKDSGYDLLAAEIEKKDREINWLRSVIDRLTGADAAMLGKDEVPGISGGLSELMMLPVNYPGTNIGLRA